MPQRIPSHRPRRVAARIPTLADAQRPNAAARGYCSRSWKAIRMQVLVRDEWRCQNPACGRICSGSREACVDHIKPKCEGGSDELTNLQTLCVACNTRKGWQERHAREQAAREQASQAPQHP